MSEKPRLSVIVRAANELSVGLSVVIAILFGIGIGIGLEKLTGIKWLFWLGVVWGVLAGILNLYKAYQRQKRELDELASNPRYSYHLQDEGKAKDGQSAEHSTEARK